MLAWLLSFFTIDGRVARARAVARKWKSRADLLLMERDALLEVVERDRRRVEAETKGYGAAIVQAEWKGAK